MSDSRSVRVGNAAGLTPQRVVQTLTQFINEEHAAELTPVERAALTAALSAYQREQQRTWLEERGITVVRHIDRWWIDAERLALGDMHARLVAVNLGVAREGWPTADDARDAAATALGYPGLGVQQDG